jgi:membrane AbrB-like protein
MISIPTRSSLVVTGQTLILGGIGAWVAGMLGAPIAVLTGPALLVSLAALAGLKMGIDDSVRNLTFLLIGVGIGSGVDTDATQAMLRWPVAFAVLGVMLAATMWLCARLLEKGFGLPRRSAYLASAPGHLSFVVSLSSALELDTTRIVVIQSVRLLALTLSVPVIAIAFGYELSDQFMPPGSPISIRHLGVLLGLGLVIGYVFDKIGLPAALLIGGMVASSIGHGSGLTPGILHPWLTFLGLMTVGTLIGARFDGITRAALAQSLAAGLAATALTTLMATLAALPVAYALGLDPTHVLIAFAPGGLETMIAMGVVLGANPGFVAACHVARLLFLTALIPAFVGRIKRP